jgi:hypothetical protein
MKPSPVLRMPALWKPVGAAADGTFLRTSWNDDRGAGVLGEERLLELARGLERRGGVAAWRP